MVSLICYFILVVAGRISKRLGTTGLTILNRIMGMMLAAISVEIIVAGLKSIFPPTGRLKYNYHNKRPSETSDGLPNLYKNTHTMTAKIRFIFRLLCIAGCLLYGMAEMFFLFPFYSSKRKLRAIQLWCCAYLLPAA